ncbi:MAG: hypothetical protein GY842_12725 [bacterium]|nr:hypothetical protein [bacterium]
MGQAYANPGDIPAAGRLLSLLRRRRVEAMTALYLLIIIYNSLVPLDFSVMASEIPGASGWVLGLPLVGLSIPDAVSNVAFYIPLGILLCATLVKGGWNRWMAFAPTLLFAAGLSYLMELIQTWSHVRISSGYDCLYNFAGAASGAVASRPFVLVVRSLSRRFTRDLRDRPSLVMTGLLGCALALAALLPMDITFSVDRLQQAAKSAEFVPFEKLSNITELHRYEGEKTGYERHHLMLRDWWMLALDYVTWTLLYAVLALVACYYLRVHCELSAAGAAANALGMCALYSIGSSGLQLFIMSRGLDVTVPIAQMSGALAGVLLQPLILVRQPGSARAVWPLEREGARRLIVLGLTIVIAGIAVRETAPFRFETSSDSIAAQLRVTEWIPGEAYQGARFHSAVDDVVRKVLRFATLGALLAAFALYGARARSWAPWRVGAWAALGIGVFEVGQLLLPSRIPGVTDVLLAWFGTWSGVYLFQLGRLWWWDTRRGVDDQAVQIDYRVELGQPGVQPQPDKPSHAPPEQQSHE